jgi:hypothetical protein
MLGPSWYPHWVAVVAVTVVVVDVVVTAVVVDVVDVVDVVVVGSHWTVRLWRRQVSEALSESMRKRTLTPLHEHVDSARPSSP